MSTPNIKEFWITLNFPINQCGLYILETILDEKEDIYGLTPDEMQYHDFLDSQG